MFVGGRWTGEAGDGHAVENPADGSIIAVTPAGGAATGAEALAAARAAQGAWAARPAVERGLRCTRWPIRCATMPTFWPGSW